MHDYEAICVRQANDLPQNPNDLPFDVTDRDTIATLFSSVYFDVAIDGRELGIRVNAHVFARHGGKIIRYDVVGDFSHLVKHRKWSQMHPISDRGRDLLVALLKRPRVAQAAVAQTA